MTVLYLGVNTIYAHIQNGHNSYAFTNTRLLAVTLPIFIVQTQYIRSVPNQSITNPINQTCLASITNDTYIIIITSVE